MTLRILTPENNFEHQAEAVFLPGAAGAFEVLKGHVPIISTLSEGLVRWRPQDGEESSFRVSGGTAMVENDIITVCAL